MENPAVRGITSQSDDRRFVPMRQMVVTQSTRNECGGGVACRRMNGRMPIVTLFHCAVVRICFPNLPHWPAIVGGGEKLTKIHPLMNRKSLL